MPILPFGEPYSVTGSITNNLRFPGQYYDSETGLHYNYYRDYKPEVGRYIEVDPILQPMVNLSLTDSGCRTVINWIIPGRISNPYFYAVNNPVHYIDPVGLWCKRLWSEVTGSETIWLNSFYWKLVATITGQLPGQGGYCIYNKYQKGRRKEYVTEWYLCCNDCECSITKRNTVKYKNIERVVKSLTIKATLLCDEYYCIAWCDPYPSWFGYK
jgi:RHS repeat-associated protein